MKKHLPQPGRMKVPRFTSVHEPEALNPNYAAISRRYSVEYDEAAEDFRKYLEEDSRVAVLYNHAAMAKVDTFMRGFIHYGLNLSEGSTMHDLGLFVAKVIALKYNGCIMKDQISGNVDVLVGSRIFSPHQCIRESFRRGNLISFVKYMRIVRVTVKKSPNLSVIEKYTKESYNGEFKRCFN